jgi:membrane protease subunit (stomatin/prohibitin family)
LAFFGQGKSTIEWQEARPDVLFYKWKENEIKKGSHLIIRPGQKAIFYANGVVEGVFENPGNYDIYSDIVPFLSTLKGILQLRGDTGLRAEVYFVNAKELLLPWGTRQRIMIPTPETPGGIPVGMNGNLVIEFKDYLKFIERIAGVRQTYALSDISERIMGELNPIIAEAILNGQTQVGVGVLVSLQQNNRSLAKKIKQEIDMELLDFGLGVRDFNIISINYPESIQKRAEEVASQAFVGDVGRYATIKMADNIGKGGGSDIASMAAQFAMGANLAQNITNSMNQNQAQPSQQTQTPQGDRFCPKCRKMVSSKFCPDCGTETV